MPRKSGGDDADEDGDQLWARYARDISPLDKKRAVKPSAAAPGVKPLKKAKPVPPAPSRKTTAAKVPPQLDARTEQKLRRGKMDIDGRLDLHGMTQAQAHNTLKAFVIGAEARGKRCLLIITGKGRGEGTGVLRQKFPQWMTEPDLKNIVLKILPAALKDGGSGAWYVYLKRRRDY